jgi:CubicO group peptidase (beta-lactamase class C family)
MRTDSIFVATLLALIPVGALSACGSDDPSQPSSQKADAGADVEHDALEDAAPQDGSPDVTEDALPDVIVDRFAPIAKAIEDERIKLGAPGVAVAILEGGMVTFASGFGSKDPNGDDPVLASTLFRIGSVNKVLTATALLQLVESGDIDLDAPMTTYLPSLAFAKDASWAPSIKTRHLITHESAVVDFLEIDSSPAKDADLSAVMLGPFAQEGYLMAPAGRMYNYSNPGYMYAGLVAQAVSGSWYRTLMAERVFAPLGMDRTFFLPTEVTADGDYALGKTRHWETGLPLVVQPSTYDNAWGRPAGYAWSSVLDLAEFVKFLRDGNAAVLSDTLRENMMQPQVDTKEFLDRMGYGYGLLIQQGIFLPSFHDIKIVTHGGAIPGFAADLYYVPACDLGLITLANTDGAYFINSLVTTLKTLCTLPAPSTAPDLKVDPASFGAFLGTYEDPYNVGTIHVTLDGNQLKVEMPLLDSLKIPYDPVLAPSLPDNFVLTVQGAELPVTFLRDDQEQVEYLRTRAFVGARVEVDAGAPTWVPVSKPIDPTAWVRRLREPVWRPGLLPSRP